MDFNIYEGYLNFELEEESLQIKFKVEFRDPDWYESLSPESIEWTVLEIEGKGKSFTLKEVDLFELMFEERLNKLIIEKCLTAKEKFDESYTLRDV